MKVRMAIALEEDLDRESKKRNPIPGVVMAGTRIKNGIEDKIQYLFVC